MTRRAGLRALRQGEAMGSRLRLVIIGEAAEADGAWRLVSDTFLAKGEYLAFLDDDNA